MPMVTWLKFCSSISKNAEKIIKIVQKGDMVWYFTKLSKVDFLSYFQKCTYSGRPRNWPVEIY